MTLTAERNNIFGRKTKFLINTKDSLIREFSQINSNDVKSILINSSDKCLFDSPLVVLQQSIALDVDLAVALGPHVLLTVLGGSERLVTPETHVTLTNLGIMFVCHCGMRIKLGRKCLTEI